MLFQQEWNPFPKDIGLDYSLLCKSKATKRNEQIIFFLLSNLNSSTNHKSITKSN